MNPAVLLKKRNIFRACNKIKDKQKQWIEPKRLLSVARINIHTLLGNVAAE